MSPHHPAAKEMCGLVMVYDWRTDTCMPSDLAPLPPTAQQMEWMGICTSLQPALLSPCTSLVSSNGALTYDGDRAVGCIRNGALLAAAAGLNAIPLDWIIGGLQALEGPTGCSGIVNWEMLNQVGNTGTIIDLLS